MTVLDMHGEAARLDDKVREAGEAGTMQMEADAKFLRGILAALILFTVAIGAAAGYAAVYQAPETAAFAMAR